MKKAVALLFMLAAPCFSQLQTVFNPYTGKPDYVNAVSTASSSGNFINNANTLQAGATFYVSSGTVLAVTASSVTLSRTDSLTTSTATFVTVQHASTGTTAAGFGSAITYNLQDSNGDMLEAARTVAYINKTVTTQLGGGYRVYLGNTTSGPEQTAIDAVADYATGRTYVSINQPSIGIYELDVNGKINAATEYDLNGNNLMTVSGTNLIFGASFNLTEITSGSGLYVSQAGEIGNYQQNNQLYVEHANADGFAVRSGFEMSVITGGDDQNGYGWIYSHTTNGNFANRNRPLLLNQFGGNIAIGHNTILPAATLEVVSDVTSNYILTVSTDAATYTLDVSSNGHINGIGTAPSVTSCGTSPTLAAGSTDWHGTINVGGGVVTACTLTFAVPFNVRAPDCVVSDNSATISSGVTSKSGSSITIGTSATLGGGQITYICFGSD